MIMDMLGVIIAFISVILLFSLLVTALVQLLDFRGDRKHFGLVKGMRVFANSLIPESLAEDKNKANQFINEFTQATTQTLMGIKATYVTLEQVESAYQQITHQAPPSTLKAKFCQIEDEMKVIYKRNSDLLSILIAAILVFVMQLNAFELFDEIYKDAELRAVLVSLGENYTSNNDTLSIAQAQLAQVNSFNFDPFPNKNFADAYFDLKQLIGMLLSTILISFGAPFWFNTLKNVVGLRDAIAAKSDVGKTQK